MRNLKSRIIPSAWKRDIDGVVERELVGANRYFAEANPRLGELIEEISTLPPTEFYQELRSRWNWHNQFYEDLLEPALPLLLEPSAISLTPSQIVLIRDVYRTSSLVDQATLVVSAAIKKHVEGWMEILPECRALDNEEARMLVTSPRDSYPTRYLIDHLLYLIAEKDGLEVGHIRQDLLERYHAGDEDIFAGRLKQLAPLPCFEAKRLKEIVQELECQADRRIRSFYLTLERPRLKVIQNILDYDNNEEKRIVRELIGISGFVFRKEVLRYLAETDILPGGKGIYEYQDDTIDTALASLANCREEMLDRQVTPYQQHGLTCTAACLTMAAAHFGLVRLGKTFEAEVAEASKSRLVAGQHFSGVAAKAVSLGIEVVLLHSSPQMFDNSEGWLPRHLFHQLVHEYKGYLSGLLQSPLLKVENGISLHASNLRGYLQQGYLILVAGVLGGILHAILLTGYSPKGYIVIDPLNGERRIDHVDMVDVFMNTRIGRWVMLVRPSQHPVDKLKSSLSSFEHKALAYLG